MKPVLIVEGKQYDVAQVEWHDGKPIRVGVFEGNTYVIYHDESANEYIEIALKINLAECLKWLGRYDELYETLDKVIADKNDELIHLAIANIEEQQPFTPNDKQKEYFFKQREMMGLMDAQEIIHEFMVEDVDLSGGEEIEPVQ